MHEQAYHIVLPLNRRTLQIAQHHCHVKLGNGGWTAKLEAYMFASCTAVFSSSSFTRARTEHHMLNSALMLREGAT